jgi:hypothetical protein
MVSLQIINSRYFIIKDQDDQTERNRKIANSILLIINILASFVLIVTLGAPIIPSEFLLTLILILICLMILNNSKWGELARVLIVNFISFMIFNPWFSYQRAEYIMSFVYINIPIIIAAILLPKRYYFLSVGVIFALIVIFNILQNVPFEFTLMLTLFLSAYLLNLMKEQWLKQTEYFNRQNTQKAQIIIEQIEFNRRTANNLIDSITLLSKSAQEINIASEQIASAQSEISKGMSDQVFSINSTQEKIKRLGLEIKQIDEILTEINQISDAIKGISEQTNLLSLNAAIEAARAGDAGKGFGVVANQVRTLSEQAKNAVSKTDNLVKTILSITQMQRKHSGEIIKEIDDISKVAEHTSSSTEESAASAESQAAVVSQMVSITESINKIAKELQETLQKLDISELKLTR